MSHMFKIPNWSTLASPAKAKFKLKNFSVHRNFLKCIECEQLELKRMTSLSVLKENFLKIYSSHFCNGGSFRSIVQTENRKDKL